MPPCFETLAFQKSVCSISPQALLRSVITGIFPMSHHPHKHQYTDLVDALTSKPHQSTRLLPLLQYTCGQKKSTDNLFCLSHHPESHDAESGPQPISSCLCKGGGVANTWPRHPKCIGTNWPTLSILGEVLPGLPSPGEGQREKEQNKTGWNTQRFRALERDLYTRGEAWPGSQILTNLGTFSPQKIHQRVP